MTSDASELVLDDVCVRVGEFSLEGVSFTVPAGAYFVLMGPPGSGKTLTAETVCGLRRVIRGGVRLGGDDVTGLEPARRRIGYVPQDYALLPNRSVARNMMLGLEARGWRRADRRRRVLEVAQQLEIAHLLDRGVRGLSGGEQQRVALGRALAFTPRLLVLDEPVSALDENTRDRLLTLLQTVRRTGNVTTLHVCHNFEEMMTVAERVGVMRLGRLEQSGTRQEVLRRPRTTFVARFLRAGNILPAHAQTTGDTSVVTAGPVRCVVHGRFDGPVTLVVRPEDIVLSPSPDAPTGRVTALTDHALTVLVRVEAGTDWRVSVGKSDFTRRPLTVGDPVRLEIPEGAGHVIASEG